jgi:hypothetical protein
MNMLSFLQAGLLLHIIGLTTVAGTILVSYMILRQFRSEYTLDKQKGYAILQVLSKLPALAATGLVLQIISGVMMLAAAGGGYGQQLWFKIKMLLVILIIAGIIVLYRNMQRRLHQWVLDDMLHGDKTRQIVSLTGRISRVQVILLFFFMIIFILSVYRFN